MQFHTRCQVFGLGALAALHALAAQTPIELYPPTPGAAPETRLSASVEQKPLVLNSRRIWHADSSGQWFAEVAFARFAADGPVTVELDGVGSGRVHATPGVNGSGPPPVLRAQGQDLPVERHGDGLSCRLPGAGQYYLSLPELARSNGTFTVLFWVDDLKRCQAMGAWLKAAKALEVTGKGIRSDPVLDQTDAIQALLDRGGTFCFPAGVYRSGTLRLKSDTTVYLAPGAVLRALEREQAVGAEFIAIENATNVMLCGPGTLDANSLRTHRQHNVHHVNITSSRDVLFQDLLFEDSNSWAIHVRKSDHFTASQVKVFSGKDGFDPDASRDVLIQGAFIVSGDDAVAVKNRFPDEPGGRTTERVVVRNSIMCSLKSALKIGTETRGPIRDVTFEHCDVFDGERGVVLYAQDGGPIERAVWRDLRLFMRDWPREKESGTVFHLVIARRQGPTPVRNCRIENISANWLFRSEFGGLADAPLDGVVLRNISVRVEPPKAGKPALFQALEHVRVTLEGLSIDWQGNKERWAGVASGQGLVISDLKAIGQ